MANTNRQNLADKWAAKVMVLPENKFIGYVPEEVRKHVFDNGTNKGMVTRVFKYNQDDRYGCKVVFEAVLPKVIFLAICNKYCEEVRKHICDNATNKVMVISCRDEGFLDFTVFEGVLPKAIFLAIKKLFPELLRSNQQRRHAKCIPQGWKALVDFFGLEI